MVILAQSETNTCFVQGWLVDLSVPTNKFKNTCVSVEFSQFLSHVVVEILVHVADCLTAILSLHI